jgi:hypothetical protein
LDSARRLPKFISGAAVSSVSRITPLTEAGNGLLSSRASAALSVPMAVSRGGSEECPGVAVAANVSVT